MQRNQVSRKRQMYLSMVIATYNVGLKFLLHQDTHETVLLYSMVYVVYKW